MSPNYSISSISWLSVFILLSVASRLHMKVSIDGLGFNRLSVLLVVVPLSRSAEVIDLDFQNLRDTT